MRLFRKKKGSRGKPRQLGGIAGHIKEEARLRVGVNRHKSSAYPATITEVVIRRFSDALLHRGKRTRKVQSTGVRGERGKTSLKRKAIKRVAMPVVRLG